MIDKQCLTVSRGTHKKNYINNCETHQKTDFYENDRFRTVHSSQVPKNGTDAY